MLSRTIYFITWTTYGTWLPGDPRGYHTYKGKQVFHKSDELLLALSRTAMHSDAVQLSRQAQQSVADVIVAILRENLIIASVLPTHCHVVTIIEEGDVCKVVRLLKGRSSYQLRSIGLCGRTWARDYDARLMKTSEQLSQTIVYVKEHDNQGAIVITGNKA